MYIIIICVYIIIEVLLILYIIIINMDCLGSNTIAFTGIPDVDYQILIKLDFCSINNIEIVNKNLRNLLLNPNFWKIRLYCQLQISLNDNPVNETNYKYITKYLDNDKSIKNNFLRAIESNNLYIVKFLLDNKLVLANTPLIPSEIIYANDYHYPVVIACWKGDVELIKLILSYSEALEPTKDPTGLELFHHTSIIAVIIAATYGNNEVLSYLLSNPCFDPQGYCGHSLTNAVRNGHIDTVKILLADNRVNSKANSYKAFITASVYKWKEIFRLLISDVRAQFSKKHQQKLMSLFNKGINVFELKREISKYDNTASRNNSFD